MSRRVVIIGAGVIGLSAALECARRGLQVTLLERAPATRGASLGNAGMIVPSHFVPLAAPGMVALGLRWMWNPESPFYIQPRLDWGLAAWAYRFWRASTPAHVQRAAPLLRDLHLASREAYACLAAECDDFGLVQRGLLMLCATARALDEEAATAARARQLGIPAQVLDPAAAAALDPGVTMQIAGAVYFPRDAHLDPARFIAAAEQRLRAAGGEILAGTEVSGWRRAAGGRLAAVRTPAGEVPGDEFILAGGAWSPALIRPLGLRLPMQPGRGYSLTLPEPIELPHLCSILVEARVAVTPMGRSLRVGGTMEITHAEAPPRPRRVAGILKSIPRYFPRFTPAHFAGLEPWHGLRPCSPDGLPYLGRTAAAPNLIVATGHAMMGLSLAPITGRLVAQLATRQPPEIELSLLAPDRYA